MTDVGRIGREMEWLEQGFLSVVGGWNIDGRWVRLGLVGSPRAEVDSLLGFSEDESTQWEHASCACGVLRMAVTLGTFLVCRRLMQG